MLFFYERGLRWALRHRKTMLLITLLTVVVNVALFARIPKGLFPQQDTGLLIATTEAAQDVSYAQMFRLQTRVNNVLNEDSDIDHYVAFIGSGGGGTTNMGNAFITLKPLPPRRLSADQVLGHLRGKLAKIEGINTYLQSRQDVNVGGRMARTQYQYTVQDANLEELRAWSPRVLEAMRKLSQLKDVASDQQSAGLRLDIDVDRDTASRLGVTMRGVDDALYDAYGQRFVATTFTQMNQYHVVLEAAEPQRSTLDSLDGIYVKSATGASVPLRAIAKTTPAMAALAVNHHGQFPAVTISFNLSPDASLGQAVNAIDQAELAIHLPPSVHADFQGTAQAFTSSLKSEPILVIAALLAVYIVLGMLYESYIHPITILSTLPSAGIGAIVALLLFGVDLSIIAIVGLLLLIGIVKKNAILLIDFAIEAERSEGARPEEAIVRACSLRFRPILMTTCAAIFGALPLAFGHGLGSELRRPLGITIVGGLLASQLLTLYTTPVVYLALQRWSRRRSGTLVTAA
jgi:multidrug efflux pump subunit AcrB